MVYSGIAHMKLLVTCVELTNTTTAILQYSDTVEGSLLTISCLEGYYLPGGDMMSVCTNGSWSPNPLNTMCLPEGIVNMHVYNILYFLFCILPIYCYCHFQGCAIAVSV